MRGYWIWFLSPCLFYSLPVLKSQKKFSLSPSGLQAHTHKNKKHTGSYRASLARCGTYLTQFASVDLDKCHIIEERERRKGDRERERILAFCQTSIMIPKIWNTSVCTAPLFYPIHSALSSFIPAFIPIYPSCCPSFSALCLSCLAFSPLTWARAVLWGV